MVFPEAYAPFGFARGLIQISTLFIKSVNSILFPYPFNISSINLNINTYPVNSFPCIDEVYKKEGSSSLNPTLFEI